MHWIDITAARPRLLPVNRRAKCSATSDAEWRPVPLCLCQGRLIGIKKPMRIGTMDCSRVVKLFKGTEKCTEVVTYHIDYSESSFVGESLSIPCGSYHGRAGKCCMRQFKAQQTPRPVDVQLLNGTTSLPLPRDGLDGGSSRSPSRQGGIDGPGLIRERSR